jgi:hypothetical protein
LEFGLDGLGQVQGLFVVRASFVPAVLRSERVAHRLICGYRVGRELDGLLGFVERGGGIIGGEKVLRFLRVAEPCGQRNFESSLVDVNSVLDNVDRLGRFKYFVRIQRRRAKFETGEVAGADQNRAVDDGGTSSG